MEEASGNNDNPKPRDAEFPLTDMRNWQLIPSANESPVKSTAVVKYSAVQRAASFARLQCNTDLNLPPSNWLTSSAESYGLQHVPTHSTGFSSFRLAHMFPDCVVGQVDIVSDAENIKKLLKIPYSRGAVSMIVHRVDNTLLIDDFDVHKLLLQQSKSDWEWLREFLLNHVFQSMSIKDKGLVPSHHRRSALQSKHLVSKFLHHSLAATNPPPPPPLLQPASHFSVSASEPPLPEPKATEELPGSGSKDHKFLRNVVWNFEDLQMLLGTDMPIFGGPAHPCISLRLCDMAKPISVLTGIDYWLDNLMSNVPEVVMCFHLDGIVKRYELVKTEDLPYFNESKFSPKVIRDVAQNILSFLKTNAAKAGHTYWLFKGKDDDFVKLYDLTSLCSENVDEKGQNPFTVPVAMLLYRVARNMKHSVEGQYKRSTIAVLLDNCVRLLDAQKYPQIVTSAHYMLSDLFIPATIDPAKPLFDDELDDEEKQEGNENLNNTSTKSLYKKKDATETKSTRKKTRHSSLIHSSDSETEDINDEKEYEKGKVFKDYPRNSLTTVMSLNLLNSDIDPKNEIDDDEAAKFPKPPPLASSVPERCMLALKHIAIGLQCLLYFGQSEDEESGNEPQRHEEEEAPQMAKPFEPIPMPYVPLKKSDKKEDSEKQSKGKKSKSKHANKGTSDEKNSKNGADGIKKLLCPMPAGCMPTWQTPDANDNVSWNAHLKTLLYEKACLVYATLAEHAYASERYGRAVQMVGRVLRCREALDRLLRPSNPNRAQRGGLESYLLGRAGDCCFMMVQDWPQIELHRRDLVSNTGVDAEIEHEMFRDCPELDSAELSLLPEKLETMEQMLKTGLACYERGLALSPELLNFHRRIGNVHNELGCLYMSQAQVRYDDAVKRMNLTYDRMDPILKTSFRAKFDLSLSHLEAGLRSFETVNDKANLALLYSNTGRLLRLCAHFYAPAGADPKEHFFHERSFYNRSLTNYQQALANLGQRKGHEDIWDAVLWELSTALYNMAILAVESPAPHVKTADDAVRMAIDYVHRALKYCDLETPGMRLPVYQFRAAVLHHRLASLHHNSYRASFEKDERHARAALQSSRLHYDKACDIYIMIEHYHEYLSVLLEKMALTEFIAINNSTPSAKLRYTKEVLEMIFASVPKLLGFTDRTDPQKAAGDAPTLSKEKSEVDEDERDLGLLKLFEQRMQRNLLLATKLSSQCTKKESTAQESTYKSMYALSLRVAPVPEDKREAVIALAKHLMETCSKIESIFKSKLK